MGFAVPIWDRSSRALARFATVVGVLPRQSRLARSKSLWLGIALALGTTAAFVPIKARLSPSSMPPRAVPAVMAAPTAPPARREAPTIRESHAAQTSSNTAKSADAKSPALPDRISQGATRTKDLNAERAQAVPPATLSGGVVSAAANATSVERALPDPNADDDANPGSSTAAPSFDRNNAVAALLTAASAASSCGSGDAVRTQFSVTFATSGRASLVVIDDDSLVGTRVGRCIARALLMSKVPAFNGNPVTVRFSASLPH
jgi:hypothetical protein